MLGWGAEIYFFLLQTSSIVSCQLRHFCTITPTSIIRQDFCDCVVSSFSRSSSPPCFHVQFPHNLCSSAFRRSNHVTPPTQLLLWYFFQNVPDSKLFSDMCFWSYPFLSLPVSPKSTFQTLAVCSSFCPWDSNFPNYIAASAQTLS